MFKDSTCSFAGAELDAMKIDGAPDYYARKNKRIFLFESKDFLIPIKAKDTFDLNIYEEEFTKKLYYKIKNNGREVNKAILQLIEMVRRCLLRSNKFDQQYNYRNVNIYPVLITHDAQYDSPGFNHILDYWFQDELLALEEEGLFIHKVQPIVVVNIDSLIYFQKTLESHLPLATLIDKYIDHTRRLNAKAYNSVESLKANRLNSLVSFSNFIEQYIHSRFTWGIPEILAEKLPILVPKTELNQ